MSKDRSPKEYLGVRAKRPPDLQPALRAPLSTDTAYVKGTLWLDTLGLAAYQWSGTTWITLGSGTTGGIASITGDTGGAKVPSAGNFNLKGTANQITVTGTSATETWSLPSALTVPGSLTSTTTITSGTTLTATLGSITATNGNFVFGTSGNKTIYSHVATTTTAGANSAGSVTLVGGTATIATTAVDSTSLIRLTRQGVGSTGAAALGILAVGTITTGTSFIINAWSTADATSLAATDVSVIFWEIVN